MECRQLLLNGKTRSTYLLYGSDMSRDNVHTQNEEDRSPHSMVSRGI